MQNVLFQRCSVCLVPRGWKGAETEVSKRGFPELIALNITQLSIYVKVSRCWRKCFTIDLQNVMVQNNIHKCFQHDIQY